MNEGPLTGWYAMACCDEGDMSVFLIHQPVTDRLYMVEMIDEGESTFMLFDIERMLSDWYFYRERPVLKD